jgi:hypothetical protein
MKRLIPFLFIFIISPIQVNAACSGSDCCTVSSNVVTLDSGSSCALTPDSYGITVYEKYLCTAAPTAPTTTSAVDLSNCVQTFASTNGSTVRITEETSATFTDGTFTRPPNGVYTHGVILIKNAFLIKLSIQLDTTWDGNSSGQGLFCATVAGSAYESAGNQMACDTSAVTAGELDAGLSSFGSDGLGNPEFSATASNLNNTGASISGYLLNTSDYVATSTAEAIAKERLLGINTFATPVVVTEETAGFDMAFGINQGATIWSEGDNSIPSNGIEDIGAGSGPFQVIITPTNF